jgi:hypothetical protein
MLGASAHSAQVNLVWNPNTEQDLSGYKVHYGNVSGDYEFCMDVGNETTCTVANLKGGNTYYFAATAYDTYGNEGDYSNEAVRTLEFVDSDGDGICDEDETGVYGTDPNNADTDNDGINDGDEVDLWQDGWNADDDGDGLVNLLDWDADDDGFADGTEVHYGFDPSDPESMPQVPILEIGETSVDHNWKRVAFNKMFFAPVVVAEPIGSNDDDPAVIRIRDVDRTGFEIRVQEWNYLDGARSEETVSYIVMESGSYTLGGTLVEAGKFETNNTGSFAAVSFDRAFNEPPVVITAITTFNEADAVCGRVRNISVNGFEFYMQEQEANAQEHATEEISVIAWESSSGTMDGIAFEVDKTQDVVTDQSHTISFNESFMNVPVFVADMQTTDGSNTANLRRGEKDLYRVDVNVSEEQSGDSETAHTTEVVGYMVFSPIDPTADTDGDGLSNIEELDHYGTDPSVADTDGDGMNDGDEVNFWTEDGWDADDDCDGLVNLLDLDSDADGLGDGVEVHYNFDPSDPVSRPELPLMKIGEIQVDHDWKLVDFGQAFFDPVVIAKPMSSNDDDPAVIRIRNVGTSGFEIRVQEWGYLDGAHPQETVSYVVMESGGYTLADGTLVEAGRFNTNNTSSFAALSFDKVFNEPPVVITAITTFNESDAVSSRVRNITTNGFEFRMQEQEANAQEHGTEEISVIAWEASSGTTDGMTFAINKTQDVVNHGFHAISFTESLVNPPVFLADMQTTDGSNTANVRWKMKDANGVEVQIDEEQSGDSEINHTTEVVGYMLFSPAG